MRKKYDFNLDQIENALQLKTWWAALAILPFARRITLFVANYTDIRPNTITFFSFILRLVSALFFLHGHYSFLVLGAIVFEIAYIFDCVDGSIARLKNMSSTMGEFFDHVTDALGVSINLIALAAGQGILMTPVAIYVIFTYIFIHYMTFVMNCILAKETARLGEDRKDTPLNENVFQDSSTLGSRAADMVLRYRTFFSKRNFKAFLSSPDFEALICFIFPILGAVRWGFVAGGYFLALIFIYKILSYVFVIKAKAKLV